MNENNRFANRSNAGSAILSNVTSHVNSVNSTPKSKTSRPIEDIDINLIDNDDLNENLFGYEDVDLIEESMNTFGDKAVIYVYKKEDGRYLCYSGNQRLLALKNRHESKVACYVDGPEPSEEQRIEALLFMNVHRSKRPYYIAQQIKAYESVLRKKGEKNVPGEIEKKFGYKVRAQQNYKQILTLEPVLQKLFKNDDIQSWKVLLETCVKIPEGKETAYADALTNNAASDGYTNEIVKDTLAEITNEVVKEKKTPSAPKKIKNSQVFKDILSLPYYDEDEQIVIPDKKKEEILKQIDDLENYIERLKKACK